MSRYRFLMVGVLVGISLSIHALSDVKKSIISPHYAWSTPENQDVATQFSVDLSTDILIKRFDGLSISTDLFYTFYRELMSLPDPNVSDIQRLMDRHLAKFIKARLQNPDIYARYQEQVSANRAVTFAETKGKSVSLTKSDLEALYNLSYIYIPFIEDVSLDIDRIMVSDTVIRQGKKVKIQKKAYELSYSITGGVIWYQIVVDDQFNVTFKPIKRLRFTNDQTDTQFSQPTAADRVALMNGAVRSLIDDVVEATKAIPEFKLRALVTDADPPYYMIAIGADFGLQRDDWFHLTELIDDNGQFKSTRVGYLRVVDVSDQSAKVYQHLGRNQSLGGRVFEQSNGGYLIGVSVVNHTDIRIPASEFVRYFDQAGAIQSQLLFTNDVTAMTGIALDIGYNLVRLTGLSQLYGQLELDLSRLNGNRSSIDAIPFFYSYFLSLNQKIWLRNHGINITLGIGQNFLQVAGFDQFLASHYTLTSTGFKYGVGYEYMINPRWRFFVDLSAYHSFGITSVEYALAGGSSRSLTGSEIDQLYPNLDLNSVYTQVGLNYSF